MQIEWVTFSIVFLKVFKYKRKCLGQILFSYRVCVLYILCKTVINVLFQKLQSPILDGFTLHNRESASKRVSFCGRWALDVTMDKNYFLRNTINFICLPIYFHYIEGEQKKSRQTVLSLEAIS